MRGCVNSVDREDGNVKYNSSKRKNGEYIA